jgi:hypothetical protein
MVRTFGVAVLAILLGGTGSRAQPDKKGLSPEAEKAKKAVDEFLAMQKAAGVKVEVITDTAELGKVFPDHQFVAVHAPEWPVARKPAEPLVQRNLFAVNKDGKLLHLTDVPALEQFFRKNLPDLKAGTDRKGLVEAWLRLAQEFVQDGFYAFKYNADKSGIKLSAAGDEVVMGTTEVVPERGNKGQLSVELWFKMGEFQKSVEKNEVVRGIRPKCQATRLLDSDPVIREICEQDLLVMGRAAYDYLMEQRAIANRQLRRAIDRVWQRIIEEGR